MARKDRHSFGRRRLHDTAFFLPKAALLGAVATAVGLGLLYGATHFLPKELTRYSVLNVFVTFCVHTAAILLCLNLLPLPKYLQPRMQAARTCAMILLFAWHETWLNILLRPLGIANARPYGHGLPKGVFAPRRF